MCVHIAYCGKVRGFTKMAASADNMNFSLATAIGVFLGITSAVFQRFHDVQPTPYMDEIFHIPQTQKYCNGSFTEWDPMITTLPGLYLTAVGLLYPLSLMVRNDLSSLCTPFALRAVNILFSLGNLYVIYELGKKLHRNTSKRQSNDVGPQVLQAVALASFPVLYFFTFLYYTDVGSAFFVLLMYLLSLYHSHGLASIMGVCAIFFRQTNIVWVVFTAATATLEPIKTPENANVKAEVKATFSHLLNPANAWRLVSTLWPYAALVLGFIAFMRINQGIVVGDRSSHEVCLHFPQFFYFLSFTALFAFSHLLTPSTASRFVKSTFKRPLLATLLVVGGLLLVHNFTYVHPYLLADNRHYPFYVWNRIYGKYHLIKYVSVPVYILAGWVFYASFQGRSLLWQAMFTVCLLMASVPQKLLEFRYFILPYLMARIHMRPSASPYISLVLELLLYTLVNVVTIHLFTQKTFYWPDNSDTMHFMW